MHLPLRRGAVIKGRTVVASYRNSQTGAVFHKFPKGGWIKREVKRGK